MKLYRYKSEVWSLFTDEGEWLENPEPRTILEEHTVVRETPKTYLIRLNGKEKRISKTAKNTFAYKTKEKALNNYKKRCISNFAHCKRAFEIAKIFYENSKTM
ncbi:hypothetical protein M1M25_gp047 [Tenacibaculum phage Gundel_1]|uniref:Uncharacterized protein n=1 Tax=Tenacibaculum phage Gundel_1 TaxID=2745672 RepID=A0A8E5E9T0_9CAUD|nr:hypothetical protein M1M25_gp047 [Tenacibaculum phage Gundel_1]QQV91480.1 hypothetical protein Gundel1_47 [Tenacibaculum phage Gundel_1]